MWKNNTFPEREFVKLKNIINILRMNIPLNAFISYTYIHCHMKSKKQ